MATMRGSFQANDCILVPIVSAQPTLLTRSPRTGAHQDCLSDDEMVLDLASMIVYQVRQVGNFSPSGTNTYIKVCIPAVKFRYRTASPLSRYVPIASKLRFKLPLRILCSKARYYEQSYETELLCTKRLTIYSVDIIYLRARCFALPLF